MLLLQVETQVLESTGVFIAMGLVYTQHRRTVSLRAGDAGQLAQQPRVHRR